jgi:hypothetical protein
MPMVLSRERMMGRMKKLLLRVRLICGDSGFGFALLE